LPRKLFDYNPKDGRERVRPPKDGRTISSNSKIGTGQNTADDDDGDNDDGTIVRINIINRLVL
jgi:hypothetical protein